MTQIRAYGDALLTPPAVARRRAGGRLGSLGVLAERNFLLFWAGQSVSEGW